MYNPNQDIVAGRTAKQIEAAKRRAVKSGARKRCKKGKSCGATCINGSKVCLVDLPWVSSQGLTKVARDIQNRPLSLNTAEFRSLVREMGGHYKDIRGINSSNMPDGEKDWRRKELEDKISLIRGRIEAELEKLGSSKEKALQKFRDKEDGLRAKSLTKSQLERSIWESLKNVETAVKSTALQSLETEKRRARILISALPAGEDKDRFTRRLGLITGDIKGLPQGSREDAARAGREFMDNYRERLRSAFSILRRQELMRTAITEKIQDGTLSLKEKLRLRKVLLRMDGSAARANERSYRLMEEIRKELLKTKLSEQEIQSILSRIKISGSNLPENSNAPDQVRKQLEEFARMFNGKGLMETVDNGSIMNHVRVISVNPTERAYADKGFIQVRGDKRVTFHEAAHIVEDSIGWLKGYAQEWRDGKAYSLGQTGALNLVRKEDGSLIPHTTMTLSGRELPVFRLTEMPPHKGWGYGPNETAVVDKFMTPYMGKIYPDRSTEIISVGIEKFSSHQEMRKLYMEHPDLFETIVGLAVT